MSLKTLILCLALLVGFCVYLAGNYIDFMRESNRVTINHALEGER